MPFVDASTEGKLLPLSEEQESGLLPSTEEPKRGLLPTARPFEERARGIVSPGFGPAGVPPLPQEEPLEPSVGTPAESPIVERVVKPFAAMGMADIGRSPMAGLNILVDDVRDRGPEALGEWDMMVEEMQRTIPEDLTFGEQVVGDVTRNLVYGAPAMAAFAVGGPAAALGYLGTTLWPRYYGESRSEGKTPGQSAARATFFAAAEGIPEMIPLGQAMKRGTPFIKRMVKTSFAEAATEPITESLQMMYDAGVLGDETPLREAVARAAYSGLIGGLVGAGMGGVGGVIDLGRPVEEVSQAKKPPEAPDATPELEKVVPRVLDPGTPKPESVDPVTGDVVVPEVGQIPPRVEPSGDYTRASESGPNHGAVKVALHTAPSDKSEGFIPRDEQDVNQDQISWYTNWFENLLQVSRRNWKFRALQEYTEAQRSVEFEKSRISRIGNDTVKGWRNLGKAEGQRVGEMLFEVSTMEANPTVEEEIALRDKYGVSEDGMVVYETVRQDLAQALDVMEKSAEMNIMKTLTDVDAQTAAILQLKVDMSRLRNKPYFPFSRFGRHTVVVKATQPQEAADGRRVPAGGTVQMEAFPTEREAKKRLKEAMREFSAEKGFNVYQDYLAEEVQSFRGIPPSLMDRMKDTMGLKPAQIAQLEQIKNELAPQQSFRKRMLRKQGVAGYSKDAMKSYANYMKRFATQAARLTHGPEVEAALSAVQASTQGIPFGSSLKNRRKLIRYVERHHEYMNRPENDWAPGRAFGFMMYLGLVPKSALVNSTQLLVTTYPFLSSSFNDAKAVAAMGRAAKDWPKTITSPETIRNLPPDEVRALTYGINANILDESLVYDLAAVSEDHNLTRAIGGTPMERLVQNVNRVGGWMFHNAEKINRRVTFMAAYRLARDNPNFKGSERVQRQNESFIRKMEREGMSPEEATALAFAREAVDMTQYEYARWNRARLVRGKRSLIFLFKSFTLSQMWFLRHVPGNWRALAMLFALAGLMGLPFAEDLLGLWKKAARELKKEGIPIPNDALSPETLVAEWLQEATGEPGDLLMNGVASDWLGFDLSGSIGMGRLIPGAASMGEVTNDPNRGIVQTLEEVGGPVIGSMGGDVWRAMASDDPATMQKWMRALSPMFLRNIMKAHQMAEEGAVRRYPGGPILPGSEFDNIYDTKHMAAVIGQALGFVPRQVGEAWDVDRAVRNAAGYWAQRRTLIMQQWNYNKDMEENGEDARETNADLRRALKRFHKEKPPAVPGISWKDLKRSRQSHVRIRRMQESGLTGRSKRAARYEQEVRERQEAVR